MRSEKWSTTADKALPCIITFATETCADSSKTKEIFRSTGMQAVRTVCGWTLWDIKRSKEICQDYKMW